MKTGRRLLVGALHRLAAQKRSLTFLTCIAFLLAGAAACESPPSRQTAAPSHSRSSTPTMSPPPGYRTYVSADLLYSFAYPTGWFIVGRDHDGSFYGLNVVSKDIGTPILLREHDIWFLLDVSTNGRWGSSGEGRVCGLPGIRFPNATELSVVIDGVPASAYIATKPGGPDAMAGESGPELLHGGWCYSFAALTVSVATMDEHLTELETIYSTFRFNR
jgi:hypothetical protein